MVDRDNPLRNAGTLSSPAFKGGKGMGNRKSKVYQMITTNWIYLYLI